MLKLGFVEVEGSGERGPDAILAVNHGIRLARDRDLEAARAEFGRTIESSDIPTGRRQRTTSVSCSGMSPTSTAGVAFWRGLGLGDAGLAVRMAINLGLTLAEQRDLAGVRAAYEHAIGSADAYLAGWAEDAARDDARTAR